VAAPGQVLPVPAVRVAPAAVYTAVPASGYTGPYAPYGYEGYYGGPAIAVVPRGVFIGGGYRRHGY
jgi:hypothetical protein